MQCLAADWNNYFYVQFSKQYRMLNFSFLVSFLQNGVTLWPWFWCLWRESWYGLDQWQMGCRHHNNITTYLETKIHYICYMDDLVFARITRFPVHYQKYRWISSFRFKQGRNEQTSYSSDGLVYFTLESKSCIPIFSLENFKVV